MDPTLLLIDIQNDYFEGGAMALPDSAEAAKRAAAVLAFWRKQGRGVIHMQHIAKRAGATFFLPGTAGAEIHASVQAQAGESVIQKHFPNCFRETGLLDRLRELGARELVIAGMMSQLCVDTTTRAAADLGFACTVVHDACAARALAFQGQALNAQQVHAAYMAALQGSFAKVVASQDLLLAA